jgi:hypothetical protein
LTRQGTARRNQDNQRKGKKAMTEQAPTFTASTTDFLLNTANAAGVGSDTFILQVTGFSENGVNIPVPGLGTKFGLYIEGSVTVQGTPSQYGPGTISLVLDPTNNDGTASAVFDTTIGTGLVGFSNPEGTLDDITLATGNWVSGSFVMAQSNGLSGADFSQTLNLSPQVFGPILSHLVSSLDISEVLSHTPTSQNTGSITGGGSYITSNGGGGIVSLVPASPVGDRSPIFLGGGDPGRGAAELGAFGGLDLPALAKEILADLGLTLPGSFLPTGGAGRWNDMSSNLVAGSIYHETSNGTPLFVHDSHSVGHL